MSCFLFSKKLLSVKSNAKACISFDLTAEDDCGDNSDGKMVS
jgi:hypothetical protein